jgi:hypothetical protein
VREKIAAAAARYNTDLLQIVLVTHCTQCTASLFSVGPIQYSPLVHMHKRYHWGCEQREEKCCQIECCFSYFFVFVGYKPSLVAKRMEKIL